MRLVEQAAETLGIPASTRPLTAVTATRMSGAFITNAASGVRPVTAIDGVQLPRAGYLDALVKAYEEIRGELL